MRENRLAKLAGLKKMARVELSGPVAAGGAENKGFYETVGGTILYCDEDKKWFIAADSSGKIRGATVKSFTPVLESETYEVISANSTLKAQEKFRNFREKAQAESAAYYEAESDKSQAKKVKPPSGPQQGTRAPIRPSTITHAVGTKLKDDNYEYGIMDQNGSFEWIDLKDSTKHGTFSLSQSGIPKWNKAVAALNALTPQTLPVPAVTVPAAAPAATTTEKPVATSSNQELEDKITRILLLAQSKPLNMRSSENEMMQITEMSNYLSSKGGLRALSKIIASIVGPNLGQLGAATEAEVAAATPADARVNKGGKFAVDTGIILKQINLLYRQRRRVLDSYFKPAAPATPATPPAAETPPAATATTAPAAPAADDGQNKNASLNKKFIKAATLRRLKIRSQMEAAIDSSAQMGRARVS